MATQNNKVKRSVQTEEKILEAALDVVQAETISGTRIHLVAKQAGLFQSNIHYYFKSKQELLFAVLRRVHKRCEEIRSELRQQADASLEEQIGVFFEQKKQLILHETKYDLAELDFWTQAHLNEEIKERFRQSFGKWRDEIARVIARYAPRVPRQERDVICKLMVSMMEGATLQYLVDPEGFDLDTYFTSCKEIVLKQINAAL